MGVAYLIFLPTLLFLVPLPVAHAPYPSCSSFYSPPQPAHFANLFVHPVLTSRFLFGPHIPHVLPFLSFHPNTSQHPFPCWAQVQILQHPLSELFSTPLQNCSLFCIQVNQVASPTQTRSLKTEENRVSRLSTQEVQEILVYREIQFSILGVEGTCKTLKQSLMVGHWAGLEMGTLYRKQHQVSLWCLNLTL